MAFSSFFNFDPCHPDDQTALCSASPESLSCRIRRGIPLRQILSIRLLPAGSRSLGESYNSHRLSFCRSVKTASSRDVAIGNTATFRMAEDTPYTHAILSLRGTE